MTTAHVSQLNHDVWSSVGRANKYYRSKQDLFTAEQQILRILRNELLHARLLDIGIGTGRTTAYLPNLCREYVGIDYSSAMIGKAKSRFPDLDLRTLDARDLSVFEAGAFDIAVFSFNGIDYVTHDDRLKILAEIHRILRPEGVFVFATHNRNRPVVPAHSLLQHLSVASNPISLAKKLARLASDPITLAKNSAKFGVGIVNSVRLKKFERHEVEYAIRNDSGDGYRLLTYYITPDAQVEQLEGIGFEEVRMFSLDGNEVPSVGATITDYMIHFVTRKSNIV